MRSFQDGRFEHPEPGGGMRTAGWRSRREAASPSFARRLACAVLVAALPAATGAIPLSGNGHSAAAPSTAPSGKAPSTRPALVLMNPPGTRPTAAQIEALVGQLSGDTWGERQRAQDGLITLGEEVEPRLRTLVGQTKDQEAATRAQAILRMIADNRLVGASLVSVRMSDATPAAVLRELGKQARTEIQCDPELWTQKEWPRISVDADHQPFWSVLRDVCRQAGLEPEAASQEAIRVVAGEGEWPNFPAVVSGPFLLQANNISRTNSVKFSQPANVERTCSLQLNGYAEPKLRVIPDSGTATIEVAVDEKGNSLKPATDDGEPALSNNGGGRLWELQVDLIYPPDAGRKIAQLKGTLHFLVPTKVETLQFDDILQAKGTTRIAAGRRLLLRKTKPGPSGVFDIQLTMYRDALTDEEWQQLSNPREAVRLVDEKGRPFQFGGVGESDGGDKQTTMTLHFEPPTGPEAQRNPLGPPARLLWDIPLESRELRVPFEFNDLTLP